MSPAWKGYVRPDAGSRSSFIEDSMMTGFHSGLPFTIYVAEASQIFHLDGFSLRV